MTTSSDFNTNENGDDQPRDPWEKDVAGDIVEDDDGEPTFVLTDSSFEDGRIESDTSVRLDKVQ